MQEPKHPAVRHFRRTHGLTQDDLAILLGSGGRSYISMLESGDRVPHIRDAVLLSWLFDAPMEALFPAVYLTTHEHFRSNMARLIELAALQAGDGGGDRVTFLREALTAVELRGNVDQTAYERGE
jgi:DNA-binding XRE family transcriptional regulator